MLLNTWLITPGSFPLKEAEAIMCMLCESGWLLPMKDCLPFSLFLLSCFPPIFMLLLYHQRYTRDKKAQGCSGSV